MDQKKKDLLPSTLPSEHEQWGIAGETDHFPNKQCEFTLPLLFPNKFSAAFATDTGDAAVAYGIRMASKSKLIIYSSMAASSWGTAFVLAIGR